jgi:hypothetical protein
MPLLNAHLSGSLLGDRTAFTPELSSATMADGVLAERMAETARALRAAMARRTEVLAMFSFEFGFRRTTEIKFRDLGGPDAVGPRVAER